MQGFMVLLLICSVTMSALALIYMGVTPLLEKRYSAKSRYYGWLILVIGLIIPFRPHFGNAIVQLDMPGKIAVPEIQTGKGAPAIFHAAIPNGLHVEGGFQVSWWQAAAAVWLAGMIIFLAYHIIKHTRFLRLTERWSEKITDGQALSLFQNLKCQMSISQNISLYCCDMIGSPMLTGFSHPRILLPGVGFEQDELTFILKHELVHYKRKDLWYKGLILAATAIHWFNPIVHLMAKAIGIQGELSCDAEVVRSADMDTRQYYSETIIGVLRYQSKLNTALSTRFYGGKKGMKTRIFSIMDMGAKKAGIAILGSALALTLGTGFAFAANAETQNPPEDSKEIGIAPSFSAYIMPSPEIYAPYAPFGITVSEDGGKLLYQGQPVRQFVDEKADGWAFYLDEAGDGDFSAARDHNGGITGIERITAQKAQEYYRGFFADELNPGYPAKENIKESVQDIVREGDVKYRKYQPFGVTYFEADGALYYQGQRVKFFIDQAGGTLWTDAAGTANAEAIRDASGQLTGIELISDEKAGEYQSASDEYAQGALTGLEEKIEAKIYAKYPEK